MGNIFLCLNKYWIKEKYEASKKKRTISDFIIIVRFSILLPISHEKHHADFIDSQNIL